MSNKGGYGPANQCPVSLWFCRLRVRVFPLTTNQPCELDRADRAAPEIVLPYPGCLDGKLWPHTSMVGSFPCISRVLMPVDRNGYDTRGGMIAYAAAAMQRCDSVTYPCVRGS